ncbi:amidohydrolase family protein [Euzebya pacifica]|uniref:amidohydrolase family protein n=1 Tax=Euzebya pacifica TaxID=1608957 RepID=UPI0030FA5AAD
MSGASAPAIDGHTHFYPRGLLKAAREGTTWFGWRTIREADGRAGVALGETVLSFALPEVELEDPAARIARRRDEQGIAFEAVQVAGFLWNYHLDAAQGTAFCTEVNTELAELEQAAPAEFRGCGVLPLQDTEAALRVLEHSVKELGLSHFGLTSAVNGMNLDDPRILPVLEAMAEAGVSVNVHPAFFDKIGAGDRLTRYYFRSSFAAPVEASVGLMSVIHSGLLDRHPDLRMCFTHGGGIAIHSLGRFDLRWHMIEASTRSMARPPSEYLAAGNLFYDVLVHDQKALEMVIERVGVDQLVVGTDHPYSWDHPGGAANWIRDAPFLSPEEREKVLWRNATRLYDLDVAGLPWAPHQT